MTRRRILGLLLVVPLALAGLSLYAMSWLVFTESGSRYAMNWIDSLAGEQFTVGTMQGNLGQRFTLRDVVIRTPAAVARIGRFELGWRRGELLRGWLHLDPLRVEDVTLELNTDHDTTAAAAPTIPLAPWNVRVENVMLSDLLITAGADPVVVPAAAFTLTWQGRALRFEDLRIAHGAGTLAGTIDAQADDGPLTVATQLAVDMRAGAQQVVARIAASGPLTALALTVDVDAPHAGTLRGTIDLLAPAGEVSVELATLTLNGDDGAMHRAGPTHLSLQGDLAALSYTLTTTVAAAGRAARPVTVRGQVKTASSFDRAADFDLDWTAQAVADGVALAGHARGRFNGSALKVTHQSVAPYISSLDVDIANLRTTPEFVASFTATDWLLNQDPAQTFRLEHLALSANGPPDKLAVAATLRAALPPVGPVVAEWHGVLAGRVLTLAALTAHVLDGDINAESVIDFTTALDAHGRFDASALDFAVFNPDLKSRLDLNGTYRFSEGKGGYTAAVDLARLGGTWRGHAVHGRARLGFDPQTMTVKQADLALGTNRLTGDLQAGALLAGKFDLRVNDFSLFADGLSGALSAAGEIAGTRQRPVVRAEVNGTGLRKGEWSVATVISDIDLNFADAIESTVSLNARGLAREGDALGDLTVTATGQPRQHGVDLHFGGAAGKFDLAFSGAMDGEVWRGSLNTLELTAHAPGAWKLAAPAALTLADDRFTLAPACLNREAAQVCVMTDALAADHGAVELDFRDVPLALANDFLPATIKLNGTVGGSGKASLGADGWSGEAALLTNAGMVDYRIGSGAPEHLPVRALALRGKASASEYSMVAEGEVARWFRFDANISASREAPRALGGAVTVTVEDISWLGEFEPRIAGSHGGVLLDVKLAGTLAEPSVTTDMQLNDGEIFLPDLGIAVSALELNATTDSDRNVVMRGRARSGAGEITLTGNVAASDAQRWRGKLHLQGDDFAVMRRLEGEADISPDITLDFSTEHVDIGGTLRFPRVDVVQPPAQAEIVSVSADEVIVGAADGAADADAAPAANFLVDKVAGEVDLILGEDVAINATGLTAKLGGKLHWQKKRGELIGRGDGRLRVSGEYQAYGQYLEITKGDLIFAGPVDNPALNIRAVRPGLDVIPGVSVTGAIRDPKISLFSQPAMSDSDILSYLVTGRALGDASSGEASVIAQAALGLGAEKSAAITSRIQSAFGLDEFSVKAGETARESSLVAGKRLSPKVSVRADFNPFDRLWTLFLTYKLTPNISIEAESGESQGADLLYTIERKRLFGTDAPAK